jgi:hypothetical protein
VGIGGASWRIGGIALANWNFGFQGVRSLVFTFGRRGRRGKRRRRRWWWCSRWRVSGYTGVIVAHGRVSQRLGAARIEIRNGVAPPAPAP